MSIPSCLICNSTSAVKVGFNENKKQRYFCKACKHKFMVEYKDVHREGNPNWKGNNVCNNEGRYRARQLIKVPKGFERHHKDGNPLNNDPENIMIVTRSEHMKLDGRIVKFKEYQPEASRVGRLHRWGKIDCHEEEKGN